MYRSTIPRRVKRPRWVAGSPNGMLLAALLAALVPVALLGLLGQVGAAIGREAPLVAVFFAVMTHITRAVGIAIAALVAGACLVAAATTLRANPPRPRGRRAAELYLVAGAIGIGGLLYLV